MTINKFSSDIIYGGIDGTITTFAIIAASLGSGQYSSTIIILALASLIADAFSMGVSSYESEINNHNKAKYRGMFTFVSFILIGILPIIAYYILINGTIKFDDDIMFMILLSIILFILFAIGLYKSYIIGNRNNVQIALRTTLTGGIAGIISYKIANYLSKYK